MTNSIVSTGIRIRENKKIEKRQRYTVGTEIFKIQGTGNLIEEDNKETDKQEKRNSEEQEGNKKEWELMEERVSEIYRKGEVELFTFGMLTTAHKASSLYKQEKGALHKKEQGLQPCIVSNSMDMVPKRLSGYSIFIWHF